MTTSDRNDEEGSPEESTRRDRSPAPGPFDLNLYLIERSNRQRIAMTRELLAIGLQVRPFAEPGDFIQSLAELRPGCVLLGADALEPGSAQHVHGLSVLARNWPVIVSYDRTDLPEILRLVRLGAMDFLRKPLALDELLAVLERAGPRIRDLRRLGAWKQAGEALEALTPRERAVVQGLARGLSNKQLARALKLSPRTVEMHRGRISRKLGVTSLAELLNIAFIAELAGDA